MNSWNVLKDYFYKKILFIDIYSVVYVYLFMLTFTTCFLGYMILVSIQYHAWYQCILDGKTYVWVITFLFIFSEASIEIRFRIFIKLRWISKWLLNRYFLLILSPSENSNIITLKDKLRFKKLSTMFVFIITLARTYKKSYIFSRRYFHLHRRFRIIDLWYSDHNIMSEEKCLYCHVP